MFDRVKYMREYRKNNREKLNEQNRKWLCSNIDNIKKKKESNRKYHSSECCLKKRREDSKHRHKTDLKFKINHSMGGMIWQSLKRTKLTKSNKNGRHWEDLVGYTLSNLIKRLKKTLPKGYGWQDYLEGKLHIDHIIPKSAFNFTETEHTDFKRCWALSNLQLLPAKENLIKNAKLTKPFQPALRLLS